MTVPTTGAVGATGATSLHATATPSTAAKKTLDKEVFLALLVAQLRNQDPTSPMDTTEMMAQSTQLSSMEQLTAVAETSRESFALQMRVAALGLVGQEVSWTDADGITRSGIAAGVSFATEQPMVTVGDAVVRLDAVSSARRATTPVVAAPGTTPAPAAGSTTPAPAAPSTTPAPGGAADPSGTTPVVTSGTTPAGPSGTAPTATAV